MIRIYRYSIATIDWVFQKGTRTMGAINVSLLVTWAIAYLIGHNQGRQTEVYASFAQWDGYNWVLWVLFIAFVQAALMAIHSVRCRVLTGFMSVISGITWAFISFRFLAPQLVNTGVTTYGMLAFFNIIAGARQIWVNDDELVRDDSLPYIKQSRYGTTRGSDERFSSGTIVATDTANSVCDDRRVSRRARLNEEGARWIPLKRRIRRVRGRLRNGRK